MMSAAHLPQQGPASAARQHILHFALAMDQTLVNGGGPRRRSLEKFSSAANRKPPYLAGLPAHIRSTGCRRETALLS